MARVSTVCLLTIILLWMTVLAACASAPPAKESAPLAPAAKPAQDGARAPQPAPAPGGSASQGTTDRMVVRNVSLRLVVSNVDEVLSKAARLAQEMGGYVVSSESRESDGNRLGKATLRVPADKLDAALQRLKEMATRVSYEGTTAKDVTEEYVDQEARLKTLRAQEQQYLKLLDGARTTEDVIKVTQALTQVREQIERTEGRIQYLRRSSEMALISLDLTTSAATQPVDTGEWNAMETLYSALRGLVGMLLVLTSLAIWIVVFVPIWLPMVLIIRWWRRRRRRAAPPVPPAAPAGAA